MALLIKQNSLIVVWPLFCWLFGVRRGVLAMLCSGLIWLLSYMPYASAGSSGILHNVLMYRGLVEPYGLLVVLPSAVNTALMALTMLAVPIMARRLPLNEALLVSALAWFVTTSGIGVQYFILIIVIGSLDPRNWGWLLGIGGLVALIEVEMIFPGRTIPVPILRLVWASLWLLCVLWLISLVAARLPRVRAAFPSPQKFW